MYNAIMKRYTFELAESPSKHLHLTSLKIVICLITYLISITEVFYNS